MDSKLVFMLSSWLLIRRKRMTRPINNNPRPPRHEQSIRGGYRQGAGRPVGTKKHIKGQWKLKFSVPSATSPLQPRTTVSTEVAASFDNNENIAPIVIGDNELLQNNEQDNGQQGIGRINDVCEEF